MLRRRAGQRPKTLAALAVVDLVVLVTLVAGCTWTTAVLAIVGHAALVALAWRAQSPGTRRTLATAWMLSLPGLGFIVAFATIGMRGEGDLQQFDRQDVAARTIGPHEVVRAISGHVPVCERLVSGVSAVRRSALAVLAGRGDAEAIELLRWAVCDPDGDLAIDAALTLEELHDGYEAARAESRQRFADAPTFETAVAAGDVVLEALATRLVASAMVSTLAGEVRAHYARALTLATERTPLLTGRLARLALLTLRPNDALEVLEPALRTAGGDATLLALYNQARIAARRSGPSTPRTSLVAS